MLPHTDKTETHTFGRQLTTLKWDSMLLLVQHTKAVDAFSTYNLTQTAVYCVHLFAFYIEGYEVLLYRF